MARVLLFLFMAHLALIIAAVADCLGGSTPPESSRVPGGCSSSCWCRSRALSFGSRRDGPGRHGRNRVRAGTGTPAPGTRRARSRPTTTPISCATSTAASATTTKRTSARLSHPGVILVSEALKMLRIAGRHRESPTPRGVQADFSRLGRIALLGVAFVLGTSVGFTLRRTTSAVISTFATSSAREGISNITGCRTSSMMARSPRAPVPRSSADSTVELQPSSANSTRRRRVRAGADTASRARSSAR